MPPLRVCVQEHIKCVNYQVAIWKHLHIHNPVIPPSTVENGWVMVEENIEPNWCDGDVLPAQMADILEKLDGGQSTKSDPDDGTVVKCYKV